MSVKTDPFLAGKYGWNYGENLWNDGADENFLKFSFMLNRNIDGFVSTLPASPTDGTAYFLTTDNTLNARVSGTWYKYPIPLGFEIYEKATGIKFEFNGTTFIQTFSLVDKTKFNGIATGATVNASDAALRDRATHTGLQAISTVTGLQAALNLKADLSSPALTGTPTAPTRLTADNSTAIATTAWVNAQGYGAGAVSSVAGRTGTVVLTKADVGLSSVDNTADTSKPVSTVQQTALDLKSNSASPTFTGTVVLPSTTSIGTVSNTEISYLLGSTSSIQTQLNAKAPLASPTLTGTPTAPTQLTADDSTAIATTAWVKAQGYGGGSSVSSVAGRTGTVVLTKGDVGLSNVDNTADTAKPVSTASQTALNLKSNLASPTFTGTVVLPNTTSIGSATSTEISYLVGATSNLQSQINSANTSSSLKAPLASPTFTGTVAGVTKSMVGLGSVDNTSDVSKPVSTAAQTALNLKANIASPTLTGTVTVSTTSGDGLVLEKPTGSNILFKRGATPAYHLSDSAGDLRFSNDGGTTEKARLSATGDLSVSGSLSSVSATISGNIIANGNIEADNGLLVYKSNSYVGGFNTGAANGLFTFQIGGTTKGYINWDSTGLHLLDSNTNSKLDVTTSGVTLGGAVVSAGRLNVNYSTGTAPTYNSGQLELFNNSNGNPVALGFHAGGVSACALVHNSGGDGLEVQSGSYGAYANLKAKTITASAAIYADSASGFLSSSFLTNLQNPIWRFGNSLGYGISYFQGSSGLSGLDTVGIHFGTPTAISSPVAFRSDGNVYAIGFNGLGTNLTALNASAINTGTLADARLSFTYGTANTANTVVQRDSTSSITATNYLGSISSGTGNLDAGFRFVESGVYNYGITVSSNSGGMEYHAQQAGVGSHRWYSGVYNSPNLKMTLDTSGNLSLSSGYFSGSGSNLTSLNASNLSTGTVADARLSSNVALVSNTVTKATPSQLFQSLGAVSGSVTVNGANGTHVLATATGAVSWTFPTPSSTEVIALTLELTNGGLGTQTWPSVTRWASGTAPLLTSSGTDVLVFTKAGTNNWRGYLSSKDNR